MHSHVPLAPSHRPPVVALVTRVALTEWPSNTATIVQPTVDHQHILFTGHKTSPHIGYMHVPSKTLVRTFTGTYVRVNIHTYARAGHTARITLLLTSSLNPDTFYSASLDRTIRCWHIQSGVCVQNLTPHSGAVTSAVLNNDGTYLVSPRACTCV
jgi:WD40 repeat protein